MTKKPQADQQSKTSSRAIFWLQLPFIAIFTAAFVINEMGSLGKLENAFLRERAHPAVSRLANIWTDFKFKMRGPIPPKNKVVIVEIDSPSLELIGRWPWHRDIQALLVHRLYELGAKVVGLDIIYSEPDPRVPEELGKILQQKKMGHLIEQFETDKELERVIALHKDRLVLGWTTENPCQSLYVKDANTECPMTLPEVLEGYPLGFDKFAFSHFEGYQNFNPLKTPLVSFPTLIGSIPEYVAVSAHSGFLNGFQDSDGYIRKAGLFMMAASRPYPSLAMEMARIAQGEDLKLVLDDNGRVAQVGFSKSERYLPVTPVGAMEVNFRGPGRTFPYVSVVDVLREGDVIQDEVERKLAGVSKTELFKDALVLVGISAIGVYDMRAFPFDGSAPGVEIHANILDNLLSGDPMIAGSRGWGVVVIVLLMVAGALLYSRMISRFEAVPALLVFLGFLGLVAVADTQLLFKNNYNWSLSFFYLEIMTIFVLTIAAKYVFEERNKKFIKGAFAKYVAPAVVDSILKDPTKLSVGGEKRELTILFSDIRSFTTFSERMDAKQLASLLNDYLGVMTKIIFAHQGTLDKYIGDAIMAFWGAPLDQAAHAGNAVRAAIGMMQTLSVERAKYREKYGVEVNVGVGINSGMVNVGNMGSTDNFAYTVIGDHVNLASRLESLTKFYGVSILTSRFTLDDILAAKEQLPPHRILDFVKVKGKKQAIELVQILDQPLNPEGVIEFEKARAAYRGQNWDLAETLFKSSAQLLAQDGAPDGPSQMYLERLVELRAQPPGADWDGSWEMHSK